MKKIDMMIGRFFLFAFGLVLLQCKSESLALPEEPDNILCDTLVYFDSSIENRYCFIMPPNGFCLRVSPIEKNFYPILALQDTTGSIIDSAAQFAIFADATKRVFLDKKEIPKSTRISVDSLTYFKLYRDSIKLPRCFRARWIHLENTSSKPLLLDRFQRMKYILQAKNENGQWTDLQDFLFVGCGLESWMHPEREVQVLPPKSIAVSKLLLEDGDFLTECRIAYKSYNFLDSTYSPSGKNTGIYRPLFNHFDSITPIYSNTFYQKISKSRFEL